MPKPNLLQIAVIAAGGANKVAEAFEVSTWTVNRWIRDGSLPLEHARPLGAMQTIVDGPALLDYLAERAEQRKTEAA